MGNSIVSNYIDGVRCHTEYRKYRSKLATVFTSMSWYMPRYTLADPPEKNLLHKNRKPVIKMVIRRRKIREKLNFNVWKRLSFSIKVKQSKV